MKLLAHIIFGLSSNALAILAADYFIPGFSWKGNFLNLILTAFLLTGINLILRPILKLILGPLIVLTFGLFLIVLNALTLYLLDILVPSLTIEKLIPLLISSLIFGAINTLLNLSAKTIKE